MGFVDQFKEERAIAEAQKKAEEEAALLGTTSYTPHHTTPNLTNTTNHTFC